MDSHAGLDQLTRTVSALYSSDPSAPSVLMAWIPDRNEFYGSILRYRERFGNGKQVVTKATGSTAAEVVAKLTALIEDAYGRNVAAPGDEAQHTELPVGEEVRGQS